MQVRLRLSASRGKRAKQADKLPATRTNYDYRKKFIKLIRNRVPCVTHNMEQSASPLLVFMIASIVVLAVGVHAVFAGDPFYGSNLYITAPAVFSPDS